MTYLRLLPIMVRFTGIAIVVLATAPFAFSAPLDLHGHTDNATSILGTRKDQILAGRADFFSREDCQNPCVENRPLHQRRHP